MKARAQPTETRAVVAWAGPGQPVTLMIYDADGAVAEMKLSPTRALGLAKELIEPAVTAIKLSQWGEGWPG